MKASPGQRWFLCGSIAMLVFGALHVLAVVDAFAGKPATAELEAIHRAMRDYRRTFGPLEASAWGALQLLNASFSLLMLQLGVINLVARRPVAAAGRLGRLALVNVAFSAVLLALTIAAQFPPPLVFAALVFLLFLVAWLRSRTAR
jgi:hypothetical protein